MADQADKRKGFWGKLKSIFESQPEQQKITLFFYPVERKSVETRSNEELARLKDYVHHLANLSVQKRKLHRFTMTISGYDSDPRELYEVPEVCAWASDTFKEMPYVVFFLDRASTDRFTAWLLGPMTKADASSKGFETKFTQKLTEVMVATGFAASDYVVQLGGDDRLFMTFGSQRRG